MRFAVIEFRLNTFLKYYRANCFRHHKPFHSHVSKFDLTERRNERQWTMRTEHTRHRCAHLHLKIFDFCLISIWSASDKKEFDVRITALLWFSHLIGYTICCVFVWHFNRYAFILILKNEMFDVFSIGSKRLTQKADIRIHASVNQNEYEMRSRKIGSDHGMTIWSLNEFPVACCRWPPWERLSSDIRQSVSFQHRNMTTKTPEFIYHISGFSGASIQTNQITANGDCERWYGIKFGQKINEVKTKTVPKVRVWPINLLRKLIVYCIGSP